MATSPARAMATPRVTPEHIRLAQPRQPPRTSTGALGNAQRSVKHLGRRSVFEVWRPAM